MVRRVLAVRMLVLVTVVAIRLVVGLVSPVCGSASSQRRWRRGCGRDRRLNAAKRRRTVEPPSSAAELAAASGQDPVTVEMRRITEQLRVQGRG
jgi:hypothetical protein